MRAISALSRDAGMSTRVCLAVTALRIRVIMSAIGSVIFSNSPSQQKYPSTPLGMTVSEVEGSPAALRDAGNVALEGQLAEAEAAQRELAHEAARPAAQLAAVAQPNLELRRLELFRYLRSRGHRY